MSTRPQLSPRWSSSFSLFQPGKLKLELQLFAVALLSFAYSAFVNNSVHVAYHWHLHQPIYWPEVNPTAPQNNRYQFAADSFALKYANSGNFYVGSTYKHPRNALASGDGGEFDSMFDKADRVNAYQVGGWSNVSGALTTAGPLQLELGYTSGLNSNSPAGLFRVKLLP